jgi:hypothetical protein
MRLSSIQVESFVEIHAHAQFGFIHIEEPPEPRAEEPHHLRIRVREADFTIALGSFACIERCTSSEKRLIIKCADASETQKVALLDLAQLSQVRGVRAALGAVAAFGGGERDVADPEGDGRLGDAELLGDIGEGEILRAEAARRGLCFELASVPHERNVSAGCDSRWSARSVSQW